MIAARRINNQQLASQGFFAFLNLRRAREFRLIVILTLVHLPLGPLLYQASFAGLLHPVGAFAVGMHYAVQKKVSLDRVALVCAYIIGSEVLWRMANIPIFWEFGKYGSAAIMIVALVRRGLLSVPALPSAYFLFLIPACFLTIVSNGASEARSMLSFNMSGPFLLFVSCWFFSHAKLNYVQIRRLFLAIVIPLLSVACTTLFYTVTTENIQFGTESNEATSGGFGPNQVSSMLGFGAFAAFACFLLFRNTAKFKIYLGLAMLLLTAQSVMTFSRGGMYNAVGAGFILVLFRAGNLKVAAKRLFPIIAAAIFFLLVIFPVLNQMTGGKLQERFSDPGTTQRSEIIESDFAILQENPVLGIGVGEAKQYRKRFLEFRAASHTEFSRLLSEHGSLGIMALLCLLVVTVFNIRRQESNIGKAFVAGLVFWSGLFMMNAGMRLAAPSFAWGLSFAMIANMRLNRRKRSPANAGEDSENSHSRHELIVREPKA